MITATERLLKLTLSTEVKTLYLSTIEEDGKFKKRVRCNYTDGENGEQTISNKTYNALIESKNAKICVIN